MDGQYNHLNVAPEVFVNGDNGWLRETFKDNDMHIDDLREQTVMATTYVEDLQQKNAEDEAWKDLLGIFAQSIKPK